MTLGQFPGRHPRCCRRICQLATDASGACWLYTIKLGSGSDRHRRNESNPPLRGAGDTPDKPGRHTFSVLRPC